MVEYCSSDSDFVGRGSGTPSGSGEAKQAAIRPRPEQRKIFKDSQQQKTTFFSSLLPLHGSTSGRCFRIRGCGCSGSHRHHRIAKLSGRGCSTTTGTDRTSCQPTSFERSSRRTTSKCTYKVKIVAFVGGAQIQARAVGAVGNGIADIFNHRVLNIKIQVQPVWGIERMGEGAPGRAGFSMNHKMGRVFRLKAKCPSTTYPWGMTQRNSRGVVVVVSVWVGPCAVVVVLGRRSVVVVVVVVLLVVVGVGPSAVVVVVGAGAASVARGRQPQLAKQAERDTRILGTEESRRNLLVIAAYNGQPSRSYSQYTSASSLQRQYLGVGQLRSKDTWTQVMKQGVRKSWRARASFTRCWHEKTIPRCCGCAGCGTSLRSCGCWSRGCGCGCGSHGCRGCRGRCRGRGGCRQRSAFTHWAAIAVSGPNCFRVVFASAGSGCGAAVSSRRRGRIRCL